MYIRPNYLIGAAIKRGGRAELNRPAVCGGGKNTHEVRCWWRYAELKNAEFLASLAARSSANIRPIDLIGAAIDRGGRAELNRPTVCGGGRNTHEVRRWWRYSKLIIKERVIYLPLRICSKVNIECSSNWLRRNDVVVVLMAVDVMTLVAGLLHVRGNSEEGPIDLYSVK